MKFKIKITVYIFLRTDASLLELTGLVREVNYEARRRGTRFSFAQVPKKSFSFVISTNDN